MGLEWKGEGKEPAEEVNGIEGRQLTAACCHWAVGTAETRLQPQGGS